VSVRELALVSDISFALRGGERVGLIGESGSGKSLTALALLGLLPENLKATGSVRLAEVDADLLGAAERHLNEVRGRRIAMVFQEPMTALNPVMRVGKQIAEAMLLHGTRPSRRAARQAAIELLGRVRMPDPAAASPCISTSAVRRPAAAGDARHRAGQRSGRPHLRRTHDRAGCHGTGANAGADPRRRGREWIGAVIHHPRFLRSWRGYARECW
jgi:ABC-type histidine transport system ATPase subunit